MGLSTVKLHKIIMLLFLIAALGGCQKKEGGQDNSFAIYFSEYLTFLTTADVVVPKDSHIVKIDILREVYTNYYKTITTCIKEDSSSEGADAIRILTQAYSPYDGILMSDIFPSEQELDYYGGVWRDNLEEVLSTRDEDEGPEDADMNYALMHFSEDCRDSILKTKSVVKKIVVESMGD